jgi:hypothetical protein
MILQAHPGSVSKHCVVADAGQWAVATNRRQVVTVTNFINGQWAMTGRNGLFGNRTRRCC